MQGFPGGSVVKNPPSSAGDMASIPGLGRSTCHRATKPVATTTEPVLQSPGTTTTKPHSATTEAHMSQSPCSATGEATAMRSPCTVTDSSPHSLQLEKSLTSNKDPAQPKQTNKNSNAVCASVYVLVTRSCPTLCDPMDCSLPGFSVHGILQARILQWVAFPSPMRIVVVVVSSLSRI